MRTCTHTLPLSLWLRSGRVTLEKLHYVSLRAGHLVNEALPGEEKQPARTGCFLPWLWSREKVAQDGGGVEENRPFSTRSQTSECKTLCWLDVMGVGGEGTPPSFLQGPRLPTLDVMEHSGRTVASPLENGR